MLTVLMLTVLMLTVVMINVIMPNVGKLITLFTAMLSAIIQIVAILSVVILSVVAPFFCFPSHGRQPLGTCGCKNLSAY